MKRIGFTASAFDLLHPGHVMMLEEAKEHCDWLICGLHVDPSIQRKEKSAPMQSLIERYTQLAAVKHVDQIVPYQFESELLDIMALYRVSVRIVGEEYRGTDFTGKTYCNAAGVKIVYNSRKHTFSSTAMRSKLKGEK